jgi:hypothetical protein
MEGRAMADQQCTGDHSQHICALAQDNKFQAVKRLITEPNYMCLFCGRVADLDDNLCKPVHVDAIGLVE